MQVALAQAVERRDDRDPEVAGQAAGLAHAAGAVHDDAVPVAAARRVADLADDVPARAHARGLGRGGARDAVAVQDRDRDQAARQQRQHRLRLRLRRGTGAFAASAIAWCAIGFATSATPTTTRPSSSSMASPAATTAIVRQGWWRSGPGGLGCGRTCSTADRPIRRRRRRSCYPEIDSQVRRRPSSSGTSGRQPSSRSARETSSTLRCSSPSRAGACSASSADPATRRQAS